MLGTAVTNSIVIMLKLPIGNTLIADRIRYRGRETNNVDGKNITIFDKENYAQ